MYEVTKFLSLTNHTYSAIELIISKRTMDKLTPEQRAAVIEAGKVATAAQRKATGNDVKDLLSGLQKKGMTVNSVGDVAAFRQSVQPIYEKARKTVGDTLMNQALDAVK
jgi:TRAP-type C4-dicarboxylate transport system substrate-binding protein